MLTVSSAASAPAITSVSSATATFGVAFSFTVNTTGYPAPKLTKSGVLPAGVTFVDNGNVNGIATISGTPAKSAIGVYTGYPAPKLTEIGALPKGVAFSAPTGTFSGTPKTGTAGSYPIIITATNSSKAVTQLFNLTVQ